MSEERIGAVRRLRDWLEILSFAAVVVGIVVGFSDHFATKRNERAEAKAAVYDSLDAAYREHLQFWAQFPRLNPRVRPAGAAAPDLTVDERTQQHAMYALLVRLFERAYLEFHDPSTAELIEEEYQDEWAGWMFSIDAHAADPAFREAWRRVGPELDVRFQSWMGARLR